MELGLFFAERSDGHKAIPGPEGRILLDRTKDVLPPRRIPTDAPKLVAVMFRTHGPDSGLMARVWDLDELEELSHLPTLTFSVFFVVFVAGTFCGIGDWIGSAIPVRFCSPIRTGVALLFGIIDAHRLFDVNGYVVTFQRLNQVDLFFVQQEYFWITELRSPSGRPADVPSPAVNLGKDRTVSLSAFSTIGRVNSAGAIQAW